jgi:hypothetical protein
MKTKERPVTVFKGEGNGLLSKNVRFFMSHALWDKLTLRALEEGKKAGRPRSVASVMRNILEAGVKR